MSQRLERGRRRREDVEGETRTGPDIRQRASADAQARAAEEAGKEAEDGQAGGIVGKARAQGEDGEQRQRGKVDGLATESLTRGTCDDGSQGEAQQIQAEGQNGDLA